jgi:hypothetical protein
MKLRTTGIFTGSGPRVSFSDLTFFEEKKFSWKMSVLRWIRNILGSTYAPDLH